MDWLPPAWRRVQRSWVEASYAHGLCERTFEVKNLFGESVTASPSGSGSAAARSPTDIDWVLGRNPAIRRVAQHAMRAAEVECTVLISGETGTGKEIWARVLAPQRTASHEAVRARQLRRPDHDAWPKANCSATRKAPSPAPWAARSACFRAAEGGIVFLDEIGEMPLELQPKLLRVLQQREVTPVGASHPVAINVQVIAATNRDLEAEVAAGRFREDLFYRLNMVELRVPPLRERIDDIPELIEFFSARFAAKYQRPVWRPDPRNAPRFLRIRLAGQCPPIVACHRASRMCSNRTPCLPTAIRRNVRPARCPSSIWPASATRRFARPSKRTRGHKGRAAKLLGVHPNTLTRLIAQPDPADDDSLAGNSLRT